MVLNGRTEGIAKSSYQRIWDFALENGYSPRGMKMEIGNGLSPSMHTVGYLLRAPLRLANKSNFFSHVHEGLHNTLVANDAHTLFLGSEDLLTEKDYKQFQKIRRSMRGVVVMGEVAPTVVKKMAALFQRVVYVGARLTGVCHSVTSNDHESVEQLLNHLCSLGHEQFAWLGGSPDTFRNTTRLAALRESLKTRGVELQDRWVDTAENADWKDGFTVAEKLLSRNKGQLPTAWIVHNGLMARGAISCLLRRGIEVGQEISVAAIDCTRVRTSELPTLTAASAPPEKMGEIAARLLLDDTPDSYFQDIVVPSHFYVGESSGQCVAQEVS